jgi:hypothetical protein
MLPYQSKFKEFIFWTWCLPQTLLGSILKLIWKAKSKWMITADGDYLYYIPETARIGGISLGKYVIVGKQYAASPRIVRHEMGHQKQSFILGPLYLLVIGVPSFAWCWVIQPVLNKILRKLKKPTVGYYSFYTEKWSDKLGGVEL